DLDRAVLQYGFCKQEHGHIGAAPGSVDRKEPQAGGPKPKEVAVGMRHEFIALFCGRIEADGAVDKIGGLKGDILVEPIDTGTAGIDQMPYLKAPATLQQV